MPVKKVKAEKPVNKKVLKKVKRPSYNLTQDLQDKLIRELNELYEERLGFEWYTKKFYGKDLVREISREICLGDFEMNTDYEGIGSVSVYLDELYVDVNKYDRDKTAYMTIKQRVFIREDGNKEPEDYCVFDRVNYTESISDAVDNLVDSLASTTFNTINKYYEALPESRKAE